MVVNPTWPIIGYSIEATLPDPPPDLIEGILAEKGQCLIVGQTNVGKTLLALEMVASVINGTPLWGSVATRQVDKALYILGEHYYQVVRGLWDTAKLTVPPESLWVVDPAKFMERALVVGGRSRTEIVNRFHDVCRGADLVVFDPLSAFAMGTNVENDNVGMRRLVQTITDIAQKAGAAVIILAHSGKPALVDGKERHRATYLTRGASAIEDTGTNVFYMEKVEGDSGSLYCLKRRKYKGAQTPAKYYLQRDEVNLRHTLVDSARPNKALQLRFLKAELIEYLKVSGLNKTDSIAKFSEMKGISKTQLWEYLKK